jgi:pimeloyl-ACP methyl ester carboxylesterase
MNTSILRLNFILIVFSIFYFNRVDAQETPHLRGFMQSAPSPVNAVQYGNNIKAGHYIKSDGTRIYYETYGQGKPFVVLHGGVFGSTYEMGQLIDSLSKRYKVIAVSTRGHGKSEMGNGEPTYEQKAKDVNAIIEAETKDSVTVLGFSDGGYISYYLAGLFPAKVKKVITIGAGEWKTGSRTFNITKKMAYGLDSLYWVQQTKLMAEPQKLDQWFTSINKYYNSVSVSKREFDKIHCPVLLLAGELDQNAPLQTVIDAYHMIAKPQLGIIPNAPHPAFQTNFDAVWADIVPFISWK